MAPVIVLLGQTVGYPTWFAKGLILFFAIVALTLPFKLPKLLINSFNGVDKK